MSSDSLVRLKQLNKNEISGFVQDILNSFLLTGHLTGLATNTGQLTGAFYPYSQNPTNYITSGQTGVFLTPSSLIQNNISLLVDIDSNYYPRSNPEGYISTEISGFDFSRIVLTSGYQTISGEKTFLNNLNISGNTYLTENVLIENLIGVYGSIKIKNKVNSNSLQITNDNAGDYSLYSFSGDFPNLGKLNLFASDILLNAYAGEGFGGNIGIWLYEPQYPLDVNGIINARSGILTSGNIYGIDKGIYLDSGILTSSGNLPSIDWENRQLKDVYNNIVLDWRGGESSLSFGGKIDITPDGFINLKYYNDTLALSLESGIINDINGVNIIDFSQKTLNRSNTYPSIDWNNGLLYDGNYKAALSWADSRGLYDSREEKSSDWQKRTLNDYNGLKSIDWSGRELNNNTEQRTLNWNTKIFYNTWKFNDSFTVPISKISGIHSITTSENILLIDTTNITGNLTLPNSSSSNFGGQYIIKDYIGNAATRNITIRGFSTGQKIDGSVTKVLSGNYDKIILVGNNGGWSIVG